MDTKTNFEETIKDFNKERDKILDQLCIGEMDIDKIREIIEQWTNQLLSHIINIISITKVNATPRKTKNHRNSKRKHHILKQNNQSNKKTNEETKIDDHFAELVNNYHNSEYTQDNWNSNECKDCDHDEKTWHTKSKWPKQGLHLVVHHLGDKEKKAFRNGFTIVKDPRFLNDKDTHWPLRVELEPIYDKKRKTKSYIVTRNEFGRREFYPKFFNRMKKNGMILDSYEQILDANKEGIWKRHPMRVQRDKNGIISIPLRFNLNKAQWIKVIETKSFKDVIITRKLGKNWEKDEELAKEIIAYPNEDGLFWIKENDIENWRKANKIEKLNDMNVDQAKQASKTK